LYPSRPTQKAAYWVPPLQLAAGSVQLDETLLKAPEPPVTT
jgi:hypothetical protein